MLGCFSGRQAAPLMNLSLSSVVFSAWMGGLHWPAMQVAPWGLPSFSLKPCRSASMRKITEQ